MGGKVALFTKIPWFSWNFQCFSHFSKILTFWWKHRNRIFQLLQVGLARLENLQKIESSLIALYISSKMQISNLEFICSWRSIFRPCLEYQVLPSVSIGFGCNLSWKSTFSRKYNFLVEINVSAENTNSEKCHYHTFQDLPYLY